MFISEKLCASYVNFISGSERSFFVKSFTEIPSSISQTLMIILATSLKMDTVTELAGSAVLSNETLMNQCERHLLAFMVILHLSQNAKPSSLVTFFEQDLPGESEKTPSV